LHAKGKFIQALIHPVPIPSMKIILILSTFGDVVLLHVFHSMGIQGCPFSETMSNL
jgi:hypothetical protein